ncbi:MAG TPA: universal stress protein [Polyangiaceae bacterium]|nr:universal stress protein [Polyangiaceae bacterium]
MLRLESILVPVDFSACSRRALELARPFAAGARVEVLHVAEIPQFVPQNALLFGMTEPAQPGLVAPPPLTTADSRPFGELVRARATERLELFVNEARASGIPITSSKVVLGVASEVILETILGGDYDLVVLGTHGRRGISQWLLGSVAEKIVRHSTIPVLTVRVPGD